MIKHCYALCALVIALASPSLANATPERARMEALHRTGTAHLNAGRLQQAEQPLRDALALARRQLAGHPDLAFFYNQVGRLELERERWSEAERMFREALAIRAAARGIDRSLLAISHDNLGNLYLRQGRLAEAQPQFTGTQRILDLGEGEKVPPPAPLVNPPVQEKERDGVATTGPAANSGR